MPRFVDVSGVKVELTGGVPREHRVVFTPVKWAYDYLKLYDENDHYRFCVLQNRKDLCRACWRAAKGPDTNSESDIDDTDSSTD